MAFTRANVWATDWQNTTVESVANSSSDIPELPPASETGGRIDTFSIFLSESCVSTLNVRMESISSSKKSTR